MHWQKKVEDKKRIDDASDVDKAKTEMKKEAGLAEVNVNLLHEKLLHLESVTRRTGHESSDKVNLILKACMSTRNRTCLSWAIWS